MFKIILSESSEIPSSSWNKMDAVEIAKQKIKLIKHEDNSVQSIYHNQSLNEVSPLRVELLFQDYFRVLKTDGYLRIVMPDIKKHMEEYINGNSEYPLFKERIELLRNRFGYDEVSLFEALKLDFISLENGKHYLWDVDSRINQLVKAGFDKSKIRQMKQAETDNDDFNFEQEKSNQDFVYIEARK